MFLLMLLGCGKDETACSLRARPLAAPVAGDANADGVFDIADAAAVTDSLFRGDPTARCAAAGDLLPDATLDAGDSIAMLYYLFAGTTAAPTYDGSCAAPSAEEACADGVSWDFDTPKSISGSEDVSLTLTTGTLAVEAWSVSIRAEGCTIASASAAGTASAFARFDTTDRGVVGGVLIQLVDDATLAASDAAIPVLTLHVQAPTACGTCTLTMEDGLVGAGQPGRNVVAAGGRAWEPELAKASFEACP